MVRYADDCVILCETEEESQAPLSLVQEWTGANLLTLHPEKTQVGNCLEPGKGFAFLGYGFELAKRTVRPKSLAALKEKIRQKTRRTRGDSLTDIIRDLNPTLRD